MKDFFKHNRIAAIWILIAVVILSSVIGVNRSVGTLADNTESLYRINDPKYGSALQDAEKFSSYMNELYTLLAYGGETIPEYLTELASSAKDPFGSSSDLWQAAYLNASSAFNRYINSPQTDVNTKTEAIRIFAELQTLNLRLKTNDIYNEAAMEYNSALSSFPASALDFIHKPAVVFNAK